MFNMVSAGVIPEAAPIAVGYTGVVPYNIPPHASRIDISTRNLAAPIFASYEAAYPFPIYPNFPYEPLVASPTII